MRLSLCFALVCLFTLAAHPANADTPQSDRRIVTARRLDKQLTIDGVLSEPQYQHPGESNFLQKDPDEGKPSRHRTEVWVHYDDAALYVSAKLYDTAPDSIVSKLGRRDVFLSSDWFYVGIDSYNDKRSGFFFGVYPSGSVVDGTLYNDSWDDNSWDAIWEVATAVDAEGWNVEMRIPYSQLRFPKLDEYVWGINFARNIDRYAEESQWSLVKKGTGVWVSGFGELHGIRDINPPARLEILPYIASSAEALVDEPGNPFRNNIDLFGRAGADIKVGLGSNLTLNTTINPDFGQVEVDPAVVNLTQFETFFQEKRPFFIEGSDYFSFGFGGANNNWGFNWGNPMFFYSRRVGREPQGGVPRDDYSYSSRPRNTTILGAAKLTGRVAEGWSLASMHALTQREFARTDSNGIRFDDVVEPLAYYGVARSLREFDNGRSAIGLIGTATIRDLNKNYLQDHFNRRAFSLGIDGWTHLDSSKTWVLTGWVAGSRIEASSPRIVSRQRSPLRYYQRPDQDYVAVDSSAQSLSGYATRWALNSQKGNFRLNAAIGAVSPGFETNDLGFQFRGDLINGHVVAGYQWYEPDGIFRRKGLNAATYRSYNYGGQRTGEGYFLFTNYQLMNYWGGNVNLFFNPAYLDVRSTRGGPAMMTTRSYSFYLGMYTDQRKDITIDLDVEAGRSESGGNRMFVSPGVEWKPTSGISLRFSPSYVHDITNAQWVTRYDDPAAVHTFGARYIFGKLDQHELSGVFRLNWTFSPTLSLQVYVQPLISVGSYSEFKELRQPSTYTFTMYGADGTAIQTVQNADGSTSYKVDPDGNGPLSDFTFSNPDFNYKSFRGNAILRWEYMPGSTLYFAWTHGRVDERHPGDLRLGRDVGDLFRNEPDNVFMIKISYWLNP